MPNRDPASSRRGLNLAIFLFSGKAVGMQYVGRAYIFKGGCGKFEYEVRGNILNNYSRVEMRGQAPRVDDNCNITGEIKDTLVFSLMDE